MAFLVSVTSFEHIELPDYGSSVARHWTCPKTIVTGQSARLAEMFAHKRATTTVQEFGQNQTCERGFEMNRSSDTVTADLDLTVEGRPRGP